jgi:uncharacterized protein (DUF885 family)
MKRATGSPSLRINISTKPTHSQNRHSHMGPKIGVKLVAAVLLALTLAAHLPAPASGDEQTEAQLAKLLDEAWEFRLAQDPLFAAELGDLRYRDKLPEIGAEAEDRQVAQRREYVRRAKEIDRDQLLRTSQINLSIFQTLLEQQIAEFDFGMHQIPITNRWGFHIDFADLPNRTRFTDVASYDAYITRLRGFENYSKQHIGLLREGVASGRTLPSVVLEGYLDTIQPHVVDEPSESELYKPFRNLPETIPEAERKRLIGESRDAIRTSVAPGYRAFAEFMATDYLPAARSSIAAAALPNGREFYRYRVKKFTTIDISPEEVHQIGLREVARIRKEMRAVPTRVGFEGSYEAFVEHLRSDPKFYAQTAEELMKEVAYTLKVMDGKLPDLFKTLPRMPYGIRPVPDYIAPKTTTAYYSPPSGDGSVAGYYYVNTYDLKSRPLYEVQALSLHEAVPGHHLQLALQQELTDLPLFRRFASFTAYIEGWGLYAERLGLEVGFYEDPYDDFGRLSYEMWRACRLVVDTGIHHMGWTRQQAINYMSENTALSVHNITAEVDRYISWPGQALGYKMGELKIRELRAKAEQQLGDAFDIREFHDVVLRSGSVPLSILEENVNIYLSKAN